MTVATASTVSAKARSLNSRHLEKNEIGDSSELSNGCSTTQGQPRSLLLPDNDVATSTTNRPQLHVSLRRIRGPDFQP